MSQLDEFLRYAGAALLGSHRATNDAEKRALIDLARVLALAALESDGALITLRRPTGSLGHPC